MTKVLRECSEDGCVDFATGRGLCTLHYSRRYAAGTLPEVWDKTRFRPHGTYKSYKRGCRCPDCCRARHPSPADRRRLRRLSAAGLCSIRQATARWDLWGGLCWLCGKEANGLDHVKPLAKGGSNWPANIRPACGSCNSSKGASWPFPVHRRFGLTKMLAGWV
jgi:5-methylcytosine-specific restriction endonuclease McrA